MHRFTATASGGGGSGAVLAVTVANGLSGPAIDYLGLLASALVERYASGAPQAVKNEAVIRTAGYIAQADFGTMLKEATGPVSQEHVTNHAGMFRNCGAAGLLSPWRVRHAGVIGRAVAPATVAAADAAPPVMRCFFTIALPPEDMDFRWLGTINGVEIDTMWSQPAASDSGLRAMRNCA